MTHIHDLNGCAPVPLAHYLKALGILRLVAEQADPQARGWWEGERFRLATALDKTALENFFLERYEPTSLVSPWNKGSGFFMQNDPGIAPLESSTAHRFARVRSGIQASRALLDELAKADKAVRDIKGETKDKSLTKAQKAALKDSAEYKKRLADAERVFKRLKAEIIPRYRLKWRGPHREWMDAAMVLGDDGTPQFPALLGTGGNDGRLDFTNNFMRRLHEVFDLSTEAGGPAAHSKEWVAGALWATPVIGCQIGSAVGQYLPGMAGGANSTNAPDGDSLLNPVDFILMMEGAVLFAAHATRRLGLNETSRAAAPFAVNAQSAGYASAADSDESARGEQWMPLWSQPMNLMELKRLLAEGRAQIGSRPVRDPLDLARAVARLGTARGISTFQRYGYIERNGQSNLAVPLGRFSVPDRVLPTVSCLDDLDVWLRQLKGATREETDKEKNNSRRLRGVVRKLSDSILKVVQQPMMASAWQTVLENLVETEGVIASGRGFSKVGPLPKLRPEWAQAADDGSAEFRLSLSFALQARAFIRESGEPIDPIRRHWLPLDKEKPWRFATSGTGGQKRLLVGSEVVMRGRRGIDDAIALVERRLIEASQRGERRLPLQAAHRASAHPADLAVLIAGSVDVNRAVARGRALMALDRKMWPQQFIEIGRPRHTEWPDDAWLVIRLALLPWLLTTRDGGKLRIGTDPAIFRRLTNGDAATAVELALRRLRAAGIRATVRTAVVPPEIARLWAAALAFPITQNTAAAFLRRLDPRVLS